MTKQKIKREEIATCPICQEQIAFKVELLIEVPEDVSILGASINLPIVHKKCALRERERGLEVAHKLRKNSKKGENSSPFHL